MKNLKVLFEEQTRLPSPDRLLASAVQRLIDSKDEEAATILQSCRLSVDRVRSTPTGIDAVVTLRAPVLVCELAQEVDAYRELLEYASHESNSHTDAKAQTIGGIEQAIRAVMPKGITEVDIQFAADSSQLQYEGPTGVATKPNGKTPQYLTSENETPARNNDQLRSQAKTHVAEALGNASVLFLAGCRARLGPADRGNRELDFLVCHRGKWGILEVDNRPHPLGDGGPDTPEDSLFSSPGIKVVRRFGATECVENPERVVAQFLFVLAHS